MYNILICDDEKDIVNALKIYLADPDYNFYEAYTGHDAIEAVKSKDIHLILLDIMMPQTDGMTALSKIREMSNVPIIMLSAKSEDSDKILGLSVGADDYVTKPFNPLEVTARVRSQLRRYFKLGSGSIKPEQYRVGGLELDDGTKTVTTDGEAVTLTPKEYDILKLLISNPNRVFSPKEIYSIIWKERPYGTDNTVAVHIRHLREKIEIDPSEPRYVKVIFGKGYKIEGGTNI